MSKKPKTRRLTHGNSKSKAKGIVVVAHPDDESLFMLGPILKRVAHLSALKGGERPCKEWTVVCVTDGNGNGEGAERMKLFQNACRELGATPLFLNHPDIFDRPLDAQKLVQQLAELGTEWTAAYTHGPLGEYGHPHHQGVSLAVHEVFYGKFPVWSVASNVASELTVLLSPAEFQKKTKILMKFYLKEIRKFLNLIPVQSHESYHRLSLKQVIAIQQAVRGIASSPKSLGPYAWLLPILREGDWTRVASKFFKIYF
ncbi:MAG: PIG-L family deacetylase [Bdellovibrionales bacterium]|nr:PIG-L family deacetylase [Bdellovibrionales bacterium]